MFSLTREAHASAGVRFGVAYNVVITLGLYQLCTCGLLGAHNSPGPVVRCASLLSVYTLIATLGLLHLDKQIREGYSHLHILIYMSIVSGITICQHTQVLTSNDDLSCPAEG